MCQRQSASEWKVASQKSFSNAWGLSSLMPCPHGCAHAHTHPVPFHTHASTTHEDSINTIHILQSPSTKVWGAPSLSLRNFYLIMMTTSWARYFLHPTDEEIKAHKNYITAHGHRVFQWNHWREPNLRDSEAPSFLAHITQLWAGMGSS